MANFLDGFKDLLTDALIDKVSDITGTNTTQTSTAIGKFLPAILGGLISKGSTNSGAESLIDLFKKNNLGDNNLLNIPDMFGDEKKTNTWLGMGSDLLGSIFGSKQSSVLDMVLGMTGIKKEGGSWLMKFLAPLVLNKLAGLVFKNNWSESQFSNFLNDQKSSVLGALPGLGSVLGFADTSSSKINVRTEKKEGGLGWLKWLLPLLLLLLLIWYFTRNGCGNNASEMEDTDITMVDSTKIETPDTTSDLTVSEETTLNKTIDFSKLTFSKNGDILGENGEVIFKNGSYALDSSGNLINNGGKILIPSANIPTSLMSNLKTYLGKYYNSKILLDTNGNLVDEAGKIILKKGEFVEKDGFYYDNQGNKLGRIWDKIVEVISNAATKTVDGMKSFFGNMFAKKEGVNATYQLTNIVFNPENHKITSFSKEEVEGLAAALKAEPNSKIIVQAFTNDGKSDKENKSLSKTRAEVVEQMLTTLGVNSRQISSEGMGAGENKVQIKVK